MKFLNNINVRIVLCECSLKGKLAMLEEQTVVMFKTQFSQRWHRTLSGD